MKSAVLLDFLMVKTSWSISSTKFSLLSAMINAGPRLILMVTVDSSEVTKLFIFLLCKLLNDIPIPFWNCFPPVDR